MTLAKDSAAAAVIAGRPVLGWATITAMPPSAAICRQEHTVWVVICAVTGVHTTARLPLQPGRRYDSYRSQSIVQHTDQGKVTVRCNRTGVQRSLQDVRLGASIYVLLYMKPASVIQSLHDCLRMSEAVCKCPVLLPEAPHYPRAPCHSHSVAHCKEQSAVRHHMGPVQTSQRATKSLLENL